MKINPRGGVTFSVRQTDKDLSEFITGLPEQVGSDIIRELIRDGLEYQNLVNNGDIPTSRLNMLCQLRRMDIDLLIGPYFGTVSDNNEEEETKTDDKQTKGASNKTAKKQRQSKKKQPKVDVEAAFDDAFSFNEVL